MVPWTLSKVAVTQESRPPRDQLYCPLLLAQPAWQAESTVKKADYVIDESSLTITAGSGKQSELAAEAHT